MHSFYSASSMVFLSVLHLAAIVRIFPCRTTPLIESANLTILNCGKCCDGMCIKPKYHKAEKELILNRSAHTC